MHVSTTTALSRVSSHQFSKCSFHSNLSTFQLKNPLTAKPPTSLKLASYAFPVRKEFSQAISQLRYFSGQPSNSPSGVATKPLETEDFAEEIAAENGVDPVLFINGVGDIEINYGRHAEQLAQRARNVEDFAGVILFLESMQEKKMNPSFEAARIFLRYAILRESEIQQARAMLKELDQKYGQDIQAPLSSKDSQTFYDFVEEVKAELLTYGELPGPFHPE